MNNTPILVSYLHTHRNCVQSRPGFKCQVCSVELQVAVV